jgi:predicted DNA-binding protein
MITKEDAHMTGERTTLPPVRVDAEFKERLIRYAASQERDVSWVIRKAIKEYLDKHEEGSLGQNPDR